MVKKAGPKLSASAKIEASAKLSLSRKKNVTEVIPPDVTRAKAGAWLDLVSPLTEWAGLKGDQLRHKRDILRLQREDVLLRIAQKAKQEIEREGKPIEAVPNKFLIPFLEQASLEDPDSGLVDLWASLLASASTNFKPYHIHFVSLISRLSGEQGKIFQSMLKTESANDLELAVDFIGLWYEAHSIKRYMSRQLSDLEKRLEEPLSSENLADMIVEKMKLPAVSIVHSAFEDERTNDYFDVDFSYMTYNDEQEIDYSILEALGLVRRVDTDFFTVSNHWSMVLVYYHLTTLGWHFANACRLVA
jgi:hypothetical protein